MELIIRGIRFMVTAISPTPYDLSYPLIWILFVIEFLATCYSFVSIPPLLRILEKTSLFQKNLVRITQASLVIFYPNLLARAILFIYEVGILKREGTFNVISLAAFTATFLISCCLAYIILFRRDSAKLRDINKDIQPESVQYTLSTKFQLTENLRVMKILMYLSMVLAGSAVVSCLLFVLSGRVLIAYPYWSQVCYSLVNVCVALWFDVTIAVFMVVLDMVHLRSLPFHRFKIKTVLKSRTINDHRGASNAYFNQLSRSWRM
ncbi:hypothetical protein GCK32_014127 [Trichostrongylus colubriformis]|uniref:Uncharacterized protein n=1 Tax=Trichostrongylus colubriformis TaxID=6319 RepID=A0AAN8FY57_TRICO